MGRGLPAAGLILPHWNGPPLGYGVKRTDNGPELVAEAVRHWIAAVPDRFHRARFAPGERLR